MILLTLNWVNSLLSEKFKPVIHSVPVTNYEKKQGETLVYRSPCIGNKPLPDTIILDGNVIQNLQ